MSIASHQTIALSHGKHTSPEKGACVMELASMLAGESFSDHPVSVCPVIGSFLRAYNDSVDQSRRQDLYAYAAKVVGSTRSAAVQSARAERLAAWASQTPGWAPETRTHRWTRWFRPAWRGVIGLEDAPSIDALGLHAVRSISKQTDETHAAVLALIDELIAISDVEEMSSAPAPPTRTLRDVRP
jgi:hypothetical protein